MGEEKSGGEEAEHVPEEDGQAHDGLELCFGGVAGRSVSTMGSCVERDGDTDRQTERRTKSRIQKETYTHATPHTHRWMDKTDTLTLSLSHTRQPNPNRTLCVAVSYPLEV